MKTLLLIDANSLIHRFFHALPPLTAPDGRPTNALYGLSKVLLKILREQKPDYVAAAFDRKEKTFRHEISKEYKATRKPTPDTLVPQLIAARDVFKAFGIATFELAGYEADDLIGTLAEQFRKKNNLKVIILSGDADEFQLVLGDKVVVDAIKKGIEEVQVYDEKAVIERYGFPPKYLVDYKGLVGDQSDNIKGVPGVGEKTATELIKEFGTVEEIFENIEIIPEKTSKKLRGQKEQALLSKKLATIIRDAPVGDLEYADVEIKKPTTAELKKFFADYGFTSLVKALETK